MHKHSYPPWCINTRTVGDISVHTPDGTSAFIPPPPLEFVPCRGAWPPKPLFWGASGHQLCPQLSSMAPKNVRPSMADQERNRVLIMEKHRASMSMGGIAKALNLSKSTVQSVIRRFKDRGSVTRSAQKNRPQKLSKRYGLVLVRVPQQIGIPHHLRYMRNLIRLSWQHPMWGAGKLVEVTSANILAALANRPAGAVIRVCFFHSKPSLDLTVSLRSHTPPHHVMCAAFWPNMVW